MTLCGALNTSEDPRYAGRPCERRARKNGRCELHQAGVEVLPAGEGRSCMTAGQRAEFVRLVCEGRGQVAAARRVGVPGSVGEVRKALAADDAVQDALAEGRLVLLEEAGLSVPTLFAAIGEIVADQASSQRLRAAQYGIECHGLAPAPLVAQVEHTGEGGGPIVVEHERKLTVGDLMERLRSGGGSGGDSRGELPAAGPVLPEPSDG